MRLGSLLAFTGGIIVGGALVLMLSPKVRIEVNENIRKKMDEAKKRIDEAMEKCQCQPCECDKNVADTVLSDE